MLRVVAVIVIACSVTPAHADCTAEAATLRAHLASEAHRAARWNTTWAILFGAAAVGQLALALAEVNPTGDFDAAARDTYYVGASKAALGAGARLVTPLRVTVPARHADPCVEVVALRSALAAAGRRERRSFYLTHLGGLAVNLTGAAILTRLHSVREGAISFAVSFPVGPAAAYTQPRRSWDWWRERRDGWSLGATVEPAGARLWLGGTW